MYLLSLALRPLRQAPWSQVVSALVVGLMLLLVGLLFWMNNGLKPVVSRLQGEQVITAYVKPGAQDGEELLLSQTLRGLLEKNKISAEVEIVGTSKFLERVKTSYPELASQLDGLGENTPWIIPRYVSIVGLFPESFLKEVQAVPSVHHAESSKDRYRGIADAFSTLQSILMVLIFGICLATVIGMMNLTRMNAMVFQESLDLLKLWGAGKGMLLIPSAISGILIGLFGGLVAFGFWAGLGQWFASRVHSLSGYLSQIPVPSFFSALLLLVLGLFLGGVAGVLGARGARKGLDQGGYQR